MSKTFPEIIESPLYIEKSVVLYLKIKMQKQVYTFLYKQLGSGFSPQSCLYFQILGGSMLLNGCLVALTSNLCVLRIQ